MAQLVVRNIDEAVKERLRERAGKHDRSLETEVREILRAAAFGDDATPSAPVGTRMAQRFMGLGLTEEIPELRGQAARPAEFGE